MWMVSITSNSKYAKNHLSLRNVKYFANRSHEEEEAKAEI
jgi:hypothetical protein